MCNHKLTHRLLTSSVPSHSQDFLWLPWLETLKKKKDKEKVTSNKIWVSLLSSYHLENHFENFVCFRCKGDSFPGETRPQHLLSRDLPSEGLGLKWKLQLEVLTEILKGQISVLLAQPSETGGGVALLWTCLQSQGLQLPTCPSHCWGPLEVRPLWSKAHELSSVGSAGTPVLRTVTCVSCSHGCSF